MNSINQLARLHDSLVGNKVHSFCNSDSCTHNLTKRRTIPLQFPQSVTSKAGRKNVFKACQTQLGKWICRDRESVSLWKWNCSWKMKLQFEYETAVWIWNCSLKMKLQFEYETAVCLWNCKFAYETAVWIWDCSLDMKLQFAYETAVYSFKFVSLSHACKCLKFYCLYILLNFWQNGS